MIWVAHRDRADPPERDSPGGREGGATTADAWIAFARTGDPNHASLPRGSPFDPATVPTLLFDDLPALAHDPDGDEQASIGAA